MGSRKRLLILIILAAKILLAFRSIDLPVPNTAYQNGQFVSFSDTLISEPEGFESSRENSDSTENSKKTDRIQDFAEKLQNGESDEIRGIYAEDQFELYVVEQPSNKPAFVSSIDDVVTDFRMTKKYGVIGMIAHNYLAGQYFFFLEEGDILQIVYGDGSINRYEIKKIHKYQALNPKSPYSDFKDLNTDEVFSSTELFKRVYMGTHHLTLQTCIQVGKMDSWGRLFLIAEPI